MGKMVLLDYGGGNENNWILGGIFQSERWAVLKNRN
jgi:hypothetical protein